MPINKMGLGEITIGTITGEDPVNDGKKQYLTNSGVAKLNTTIATVGTQGTSISTLGGKITTLETAVLTTAYTLAAGTNVTLDSKSSCFSIGKQLTINLTGTINSTGVASNGVLCTFTNGLTLTGTNPNMPMLYNILTALGYVPGFAYYDVVSKQIKSGNAVLLNNAFQISATVRLP